MYSRNRVQTNSILIISGHDFRSPRKANIHFIAQELIKSASVFSRLASARSLIKGDPDQNWSGRPMSPQTRMALSGFFGKLLFIPSTQKSVPCAGSSMRISNTTGRVFLSRQKAGCARRRLLSSSQDWALFHRFGPANQSPSPHHLQCVRRSLHDWLLFFSADGT
jgi:glucuronosyltransferase GumK-like protein